jgi:tetratricopeptide (TPR) repeat protein
MILGQLAYSQLALGQNENAIKSYEQAFAIGIPPGATTRGLAYYNMACAYARLNNKEKAFEMLAKAIDEGFVNRSTFETDTDLAALRSDPRFAQLLARTSKPAN